jgi:hypothetical protein
MRTSAGKLQNLMILITLLLSKASEPFANYHCMNLLLQLCTMRRSLKPLEQVIIFTDILTNKSSSATIKLFSLASLLLLLLLLLLPLLQLKSENTNH